MNEPSYRVDECRSCHAGVIWAVTVNDRPMPIDAQPADGGNVRLEPRGVRQAPRATVLAPHRAFGVTGLRKPHHMTCPDGPGWKRKRSRRDQGQRAAHAAEQVRRKRGDDRDGG